MQNDRIVDLYVYVVRVVILYFRKTSLYSYYDFRLLKTTRHVFTIRLVMQTYEC